MVIIAFYWGWTVAPQEKVIYKDKPIQTQDYSSCELPIEIGQTGYIKFGTYRGTKVKVVGKIDNGVDCAYSTKVGESTYRPVNSDNLLPIEQDK